MKSTKCPLGDQRADVLYRLRCAAGHLKAVIEMAENEQPCEKILHQLNAVQAALQAAGLRLISCSAHESEITIMFSSSGPERSVELKKLKSLYSILLEKSNHYIEVVK